MADYTILKAAIQDVIKTNGNNEITGIILQDVLKTMINSLGVGYQFVGIATPETNPGTPDQRVFWLASTPGDYPNFGGFTVMDGEVAIFRWDTGWHKDFTGAASEEEMIRRTSIIETVDFSQFTRKNYLIQSGGTWGTATSYKHYMIPIANGRDFIIFKANATYTGVFAFLTSGTASPGDAAAFASPTTGRFDVPAGQTFIAPIPATATYLYVYAGDSREGTDVSLPVSLVMGSSVKDSVAALGEEVEDIKDDITVGMPVDFSQLTRKNYLIQSGGTWGTATSYKHYIIPVEPGRYRYLALKGNAVNTSVYAFLTSGTASPGNAAAFASPTTGRFDVGLGEEVLAEIPETASYIYIYSGDSRNGTDLNLPQWVKLRSPVNEQVIANSEDISKMRLFLNGKRVSIIGDSITYGRDATDASKIYHGVLAALSGCEINNLGVSGTCIANNTKNGTSSTRFVTRATAANLAGSDLIIVFGGTNDFSYDSKPIGPLFSDVPVTPSTYISTPGIGPVSDTDTFAGALHDLILTIRQNCPGCPVMFITPLHRGHYDGSAPRPSSSDRNSEGNYLYEFVNAIKEICAFYAIPVLDLYSNGFLDFSDPQMAAMFSTDSLHPNDAGHEVIGNLLYKFINGNVYVH